MSIYISASSINDFVRCPQKVLFRTTKTFKEVKSPEMRIGEVVHKVLESSWENHVDAFEYTKKICSESNFTLEEKVRTSNLVYNFFAYKFKDTLGLKSEDLIEHSFKLRLQSDVFLVGKIDRIASGLVLDWKTGYVSPTLENNIQCILYGFAYKQLFGNQPDGIAMVRLSNGEIIFYKENKEYSKMLFENIIPNMLRAMRTNTYEKLGVFNGNCHKCQYRLGCLGENNGVDSRTTISK